MKSDDEFIAGVYEKAEERRRENEKPETDTGERKQLLRFRPRTWRWLTAAACLCILGGAVLAVRLQAKAERSISRRRRRSSRCFRQAWRLRTIRECAVRRSSQPFEGPLRPAGRRSLPLFYR